MKEAADEIKVDVVDYGLEAKALEAQIPRHHEITQALALRLALRRARV